MWKLKQGQPPIEIVDGPFAGHSYLPGASYKVVPPSIEDRFEEMNPAGKKKDSARVVKKTAPGKKEK